MNRIDKKFIELRKKKKKAFIAYLTAGYPDLTTTEKIALQLEKGGVDIIELGIPFSDPLADGPTIQNASQKSLAKGTNIGSILKLVRRLRKKTDMPIVFMTYYNPVYQYGIQKFVKDSIAAGSDGIIVPDLPVEESEELVKASKKSDFKTIFLAAPTSTTERLKEIARHSSGFIYYVSLMGVTGAREKLPGDLIASIKKIKRMTAKPVCVGFGISTPLQAALASRYSDGIIIGSALIKIIDKGLPGKRYPAGSITKFVDSIRRAIK